MCGVAGVFNSPYAAEYALLMIYSLQHRGQESVGISSSDEKEIYTVKKPGRVLEAIKKEDLEKLKGSIAIAHVRYSTAGNAGGFNAQPLVRETPLGKVAVVHNGNLVNFLTLRKELEDKGIKFNYNSDSELFLALLEEGRTYIPEGVTLHPEDKDFLPYIFYALSRVKGAYSLIYLFRDKLVVARDPYGFRPLALGRKKNTILVASESCAFDILEAEFWREVKPGEVLVIDKKGKRSYRIFSSPRKAMCIFEFVYFSRPDSYIFGDWVYNVRKEMGRQLAREDNIEADVVIPVPDSGVVPALGYAEEKGLPFEYGLIRNHYVGRSFIEPTPELRNLRVLMKLSPNRAVLQGKRVIVIDDSLVRGTTSKRIVSMLRRAGAKEIHMRIASPPVVGPCYYGIDTPTKEELIANKMPIEDIAKFIGVDSLKYLSLEGLRKCVDKPEDFCDACFSLNYPVEVEDNVPSKIR
ncbi:amidophosphoribosyltransferase [Aquifex aeolicus]|uniref:Amidophosphoribosyltransferase n=1 Tax=Aquifex aeolicus (strain VF5) TaxID=224324 RepID=O67236_AQUAE|nr:amidophosphoribosyltransferase [Aquifex aeolicus]AAC07202.1 amidophosphoribosyltransferase [Aquifex aeolicus VF5]